MINKELLQEYVNSDLNNNLIIFKSTNHLLVDYIDDYINIKINDIYEFTSDTGFDSLYNDIVCDIKITDKKNKEYNRVGLVDRSLFINWIRNNKLNEILL